MRGKGTYTDDHISKSSRISWNKAPSCKELRKASCSLREGKPKNKSRQRTEHKAQNIAIRMTCFTSA